MADPRFYRNRGPFDLAAVCAKAGMPLPDGADGTRQVADLAGLGGAAAQHLSFYSGGSDLAEAFAQSRAGVCLVPQKGRLPPVPEGMVALPCPSVPHAWAAVAGLFYPEAGLGTLAQDCDVHARARLDAGVVLGRGAVVGEGAEIGAGTRIGAGAVIGPGVAIGRDCEIGPGAVIVYAYVGDGVTILANAAIGQPGFGFASSRAGHVKIPQLGRVIIQDRVEIGACVTVDRGALGDTVIGEGTKIDNLVQVGHNVRIGRHCVLVSQVGIAGSTVVEDFAVLGGQVGIADHVHIGAGARLAARTGVFTGQSVAGGRDYGGTPAKPVRDWFREIHAVSRLARRRKQDDDD